MATLGQKPATRHVSTEKQTITGNGGTSYTLQQSVSQASDIEVYVNNTRQEPTVAYTASGTTLTMTGAVNSSDSFYVIFQGKAIQTAGLPVDAAITASTMSLSQTLSVTGDLTVNTNTLHVDASNSRVGIGETSPQTKLHIKTADASATADANSAVVIEGTDATRADLQFLGDGSAFQAIYFGDNADPDVGRIAYDHTGNNMRFNTNGSERMRIFSDGTVSVGSSSSTGGDQVKFHKVGNSGFLLNLNNAGESSKNLISAQSGTAEMVHCQFNNSNGNVGTIKTQNSTTSYNTSSDYRLKENVTEMTDATTRLKQLQPKRFNFIADKTNTLVDGFLAHEVSDIVPEAITGEKDAVDADGNIDPQGIDQSKLVPLLVKTIQELEARITALESE